MNESHSAYLALGSNLGDRAAHLHTALRMLREVATVEESSFLYETPPAHITDQPKFLNAACRITTTLSPNELLGAVKQIEQAMGRVKTIRFGPRIIDLDILFYDDLQIDSEHLTIPHPRLTERGFVLEPLRDLDPNLQHPVAGQTVTALLAQLQEPPLPRVMPLTHRGTAHLWQWTEKTRIMGIINLTPDSFSGDGLWQADGTATAQVVAHAVAQAEHFVAAGADCLDIGGQSTRPGHRVISVTEEIDRTAPVIEAIVQAVNVPISIDTFRAPVAEAALAAGASMLNDVWGLAFDPAIGHLAAKQDTPLIIMHNRAQNDDPLYQQHLPPNRPGADYANLVQEIAQELTQQLTTAHAAGVPRWLLIADPGFGFGKTVAQQLELVRRLHELVDAVSYPCLVGTSRKSFIGKVLGDIPPAARDEATVALGVLALERGANLLRVHNVQAMSRAARIADAVLRA